MLITILDGKLKKLTYGNISVFVTTIW